MKPGGEYTYAGLSMSLCRGALERPWLPLTMWKAFFNRSLGIGVRAVPTVFLMAFCVGFVLTLVLQARACEAKHGGERAEAHLAHAEPAARTHAHGGGVHRPQCFRLGGGAGEHEDC